MIFRKIKPTASVLPLQPSQKSFLKKLQSLKLLKFFRRILTARKSVKVLLTWTLAMVSCLRKPRFERSWLCFHWGRFDQLKSKKSESIVKTARPKLKMQAVFTRKNKGLSRLYDRKFPQSYLTSWDGIARPDKCHSQIVNWQIFFRRLRSSRGSLYKQCFRNSRRIHS